MCSASLGELQTILVGAGRCLECAEPRCVSLCPEKVDIPAAMRLILVRPGRPPCVACTQSMDEAAESAMSAIEASFES